MSFSAASLRAVLDAHTPAGATGLVVALSGGADSAGLLAAASALDLGVRGLRVRAVHIDHGLQTAAASFGETCAALCERLHIPLPDHYSRVAGLRERDHLFRAVYTRHVEPLLPELSQVMPGATSTRPAASGLPLAPAEAPP